MVQLCFNKTLFTKPGGRVDLASGGYNLFLFQVKGSLYLRGKSTLRRGWRRKDIYNTELLCKRNKEGLLIVCVGRMGEKGPRERG